MDNDINNGRNHGIIELMPVFFLLSFIWFVLVCSLFCRAEYCSYKYYDNPAWAVQNTVLLIACSILLLFVSAFIYIISKRLDRYDKNNVFFTIIYLSVMTQLMFIICFPAKQFADQDIVNRIAHDIIDGNFEAFEEKGYLYQYPNNIGITLFLSFIYRVLPQTLIGPKLLNVAFSTITSVLIYRIYRELFPPKGTNDFALLIFSCFFPPMIMLNNLVYNDVYATSLFLASVLYALKFVKTKKTCYLIPTAILLTLGNFLRPLGAIFLLAILLFFLIKKVSALKSLAFFGIVLILFRVPLFLTDNYLVNTGKISTRIGQNSIPITMWIHMGMNDEKFGYWDDSYSLSIYINQADYDKEKSRQIYRMLISKKLKEKGLLNLAKVYLKKNIWLWTEGTYQAEYYGVGSFGHLYPTIATDTLDSSVLFRDSLRWKLHVINTLILILVFFGLMESLSKKTSYRLLLPAIVIMGFIGFYTLWEIKPRYIYPVYPYLILMAYQGLNTIMESSMIKTKILSKFKLFKLDN
ncbi:MAG: hypothetical protein GX022_04575 [Clostridiaceae bacterium]|nr:hypothetical protein [Clostridiaceae bacterium]